MASWERFNEFIAVAKLHAREEQGQEPNSPLWQQSLMQKISAVSKERTDFSPAVSAMWKLSLVSMILSVLLHGYYLASQPDLDSELSLADPSVSLSMEYEL